MYGAYPNNWFVVHMGIVIKSYLDDVILSPSHSISKHLSSAGCTSIMTRRAFVCSVAVYCSDQHSATTSISY